VEKRSEHREAPSTLSICTGRVKWRDLKADPGLGTITTECNVSDEYLSIGWLRARASIREEIEPVKSGGE
jgi:hypothetical protein